MFDTPCVSTPRRSVIVSTSAPSAASSGVKPSFSKICVTVFRSAASDTKTWSFTGTLKRSRIMTTSFLSGVHRSRLPSGLLEFIVGGSLSIRRETPVKITQVTVNVLRVPVDRPYTAGGRKVDANWHVLARITTSDGVDGFGYVVYPRPDLMTAIGQAARELGEHLIGMSGLEPEAAW